MKVNNLSAVKKIIKGEKSILAKKYGVSSIGIFGSVSRGEDTKKSDVDILVQFKKTPGLFKFIGLEMELSKILRRRVDLVTKEALKPRIKKEILADTVYI